MLIANFKKRTMIKLLRLTMMAVATLLFTTQLLTAQMPTGNDAIPIDPEVKTGKFKNGLTYYIRSNPKPENRLFLRLVINAGSILETEDQRGLAHFVEHMCFNGTENFEKNELISVLERMGMKFGAEVNAYTGFDETVYMLKVPTDRPGMVDTAFQILEDWAHQVSFAHEEIDKERGVIKEEWRLGLGAQDRMRKEYFPVLLTGSRYAERLPIGKIDVIENFKYETLTDFYEEWYRPELMSVIAVGDMEVDEIEKYVKKHFSKIKKVRNAKERKTFDIPDNEEPLISVVSDPENTNFVINLFYKHDKKELKTKDDYREYLKRALYNGMINDRLRENIQKPESPLIYGGMSYGGFLGRSKDAYTSYAVTKENKIQQGIEVLFLENMRVKQHGFTPTELERKKASLMNQYERMLKEANKQESERFISEYQAHFLEGEAIPSKEVEYKIAKELIPQITLDEINVLAKRWITDKNMAMVIMTPEKEGVQTFSPEEVKVLLDVYKNINTSPYVDNVSDAPLMKNVPTPVKVASKEKNETLGFTKVTFGNGLTAILKPTDFKNDEIMVQAFSVGGHSLYPDADIMSALFTSDIINKSGVSEFSETELKKKLAGKTVSIRSYVNDIYEGVGGYVSPKDLETMLQINYLYFTAPRKDKEIYEAEISKLKNQMKLVGNNPQIFFTDTLTKFITSNDPRTVYIPSEEEMNSVSLDKIIHIHKDRFADASDFVYVFVGNFEVDKLIPLLETYLGSLPSKKRNENWKNVEPEFPAGVNNVIIKKGTEEKASVRLVMKGDFEWNFKNQMTFDLMNDILSIRLRETMREEESGVYGVSCIGNAKKNPEGSYSVNIMFGCSPDNVDKLTDVIFREIENLQKNGPTDDDFDKVRKTKIRQHESKIETNKYWVSTLVSIMKNNIPQEDIKNYDKIVNSVTKDDIKSMANSCYSNKHYVKGVLLPE